ncbi:hypothetical protein KCU77_g12333, partial [Aureobasidium melanogenum]
MPKTKQPKKATSKQRQAPYPTPPRPASILRSTAAAPLIPGARIFEPPPGFTRARPNPAYPQCVLTPDEVNQSLQDFARDRKTSTKRPFDVDKEDSSGTGDLSDDGRNGEGKSDRSELKGPGGEGQKNEKRVNPRTNNEDKPQALGGGSGELPPLPGPLPSRRLPSLPQEPSHVHQPTAKPLTEDEEWLEKLGPVIRYNETTPWPVSFYEQPIPAPAWYAECPEGYEPTTLAGYPLRRQNETYIPAAHDPGLVLNEYGHYCVDLREIREWDQCCMGKCEGCDSCRPGL